MSIDTTTRVSHYRMTSDALAGAVAKVRGLMLDVPRLESWPGAGERDALFQQSVHQSLSDGQNLAHALHDAIQSISILDCVANGVASGQRQAALRDLTEGDSLEDAGRHTEAQAVFARAERSLQAVLAESNPVLWDAERHLTREAVVGALSGLGYGAIRQSRLGDLRARRDDGKLVYVQLGSNTNAVHIGLAGHDGITCQAHQEEIIEALRRRGLELADLNVDAHGLCRGGPLAETIESSAATRQTTVSPAREVKGATVTGAAVMRRNLQGGR